MNGRALEAGLVVAASVMTLATCARLRPRPSPPEAIPGEPTLRLVLRADKGFSEARVEVSAPDGGRLVGRVVSRRVDQDAPDIIRESRWADGTGTYTLRVAYVRSDGGTGDLVAPVELGGDEVSVDGFVTLFSGDLSPELRLWVVSPAPTGVRMTPAATTNGRGYEVVNASGLELEWESDSLHTERWNGSEWLDQARGGFCLQYSRPERLESGARRVILEADQTCVSETLAPGDYRQSVRLRLGPKAPAWETYDAPVEVTRVVEVAHSFHVDSAEVPPPRRVLADTPVSRLSLGGAFYMGNADGGGEFQVQLSAPDGGDACVCRGTLVGAEALPAVAYTGPGLALALIDGGTEEVMRVFDIGKDVGDFPPWPQSGHAP